MSTTLMSEDMFGELLESIREGGAILRGERAPSRTFEITPQNGKHTREIIINILQEYPELNDFGFGLYNSGRGLTQSEKKNALGNDKKDLLNRLEEFEKVCDWLSTKIKIKSINTKRTSYGLKHLVEQELGCYISNGMLIVAAIHCGFKVKRKSHNAMFNISEKSF
jgi:hypothetical protein